MNFPSLTALLSDAAAALRRFPFAICAALVAGISAAILVDQNDPDLWLRAMMSAQLGIPLLLALALLGERRGAGKLPLSLAGVAAILLYFFMLRVPIFSGQVTRFFQFNIIAHLFVAFLPFIRRNEPDGFWQFNKTLFLRLFNSLIFTGVLIIGLNVAMLALDKLFGLTINSEVYGRLDLLLLFVFNTWYFLSGVPKDFPELERSRDFPQGLKVFAQYILAPLVAVYLALLTAYLVRVIITAEWPSGWIGWLVSSVAAAGLLSLALLHPLAPQRDNRWISKYSRVYFILMLPAVGMQIMAIAKRIGQYGITENRYFIGILALWLLGVSITGALNRLKRLEPLPITLCLIALLASCGPWGAYSLSRTSQVNRLEALLSPAGLLIDGKLAHGESAVDAETAGELSAILDYLMEYHGHGAIDHWLSPEQQTEIAAAADSLTQQHQQRDLSRQVMGFIGQEYRHMRRHQADREWYSASRQRGAEATALDGFTHFQALSFPNEQSERFEIAGQAYQIDQDGRDILFRRGTTQLITIPLDPLFSELRAWVDSTGGTSVPVGLLTAETAGDSLHLRLLLYTIDWQEREDGPVIRHMTGGLLIGSIP